MLPQTTTIDFTRLRQSNNLRDTIERYLGRPKNGKWLCPFHKEKSPSFGIKGDKFKCFGACGISGDVIDFVALMEKLSIKEAAQKLGGYILDLGMTPQEIKAKQAEIRAEYQRRKQEQEAEESKRRQKALERVAGMTARVEQYHSQVDKAREYWHSQGLRDSVIKSFKLGYCPDFPLWKEVTPDHYEVAERIPSYVIPYFHYGELVSIRHRLHGRDKDKYRPEFAGLPNQLFNVDALSPDSLEFSLLEDGEVVLGEGEKKSIYLYQIPIPMVALPGAQAWQGQPEWIKLFAHTSLVYVALDPDAKQKAEEITRTLNGNGIKAVMVTTPQKIDDMFVKYGCSVPEFLRILRQGRVII